MCDISILFFSINLFSTRFKESVEGDFFFLAELFGDDLVLIEFLVVILLCLLTPIL
jgi:hypothetical protein